MKRQGIIVLASFFTMLILSAQILAQTGWHDQRIYDLRRPSWIGNLLFDATNSPENYFTQPQFIQRRAPFSLLNQYAETRTQRRNERMNPQVDRSDFLYRDRQGAFSNHFSATNRFNSSAFHGATITSDSVKIGWVQEYASELAPSDDGAIALALDAEGNVYVAGYSTSLPYGVDYLTIKYNSAGVEMWSARYSDGLPAGIAVDEDGNCYVTGTIIGVNGTSDFATIKYNGDGVEQWVARYDGAEHQHDYPVAIKLDKAGNVYVTGSSRDYPENDFSTVKYDAAGVEQWVARFNGPGDAFDHTTDLAVDDSDNVYIAGVTRSNQARSYNDDYATIKYNSDGVEQWARFYNGPANQGDEAMAVDVDQQGNVYVTGTSIGLGGDSDYATIKYGAGGIEQWVARYGEHTNDDSDYANDLVVDQAGNVYVTGSSSSPESFVDYATVKYNTNGVEQWVDRYNGPYNNLDIAYAIVLDDAGNVYVTGESRSSGAFSFASGDYATVKYNTAGVRQWVARYNGPINGYDQAISLAVDASGNVYVAGWSETGMNDNDFTTLKYNLTGAQQWARRYDGPGNSEDLVQDIAVDAAGNVYIAGISEGRGTQADYLTVKYSSEGLLQWAARYDGPANGWDYVLAIKVDQAGNVYITGESDGAGTGRDFATIKYSASGVQQWVARYNSNNDSYGGPRAMEVDRLGNVYVTGSSSTGKNRDYLTIKYDTNGVKQWVARAQKVENNYDVPSSLVVDGSGNVYVTGSSSHSPATTDDFLTIKYNSTGNQLWAARFDGPAHDRDDAKTVTLDKSGNVYISGSSRHSGYGLQLITIKYDNDGNEQWRLRYPDSPVIPLSGVQIDAHGNSYNLSENDQLMKYDAQGDLLWSVQIDVPQDHFVGFVSPAFDRFGNIYLTMWTYPMNRHIIAKHDANGAERWRANIDGMLATKLAVDFSENVYVTGTTGSYYWSTITTVKLEKSPASSINTSMYALAQNFPNPVTFGTVIRYVVTKPERVTISIYNLLGQEVEKLVDAQHQSGAHEVAWAGDNLANGVYFYRLQTNGFTAMKKLILLR